MSGAARRIAACVVALAAACSVRAQAPEAGAAAWSIRAPKEERIAFKGLAGSAAGSSAGAPMMYPAPSLAGLLAGILTHAAIVSNVRSAEQTKLQAVADQVLEPLLPVLAAYPSRELYLRALEQPIAGRKAALAEADAAPAPGSTVSVLPVYLVPSDVRALVLDAAVTVAAPAAPDPSRPPAPRSVVVVSDAWRETDDVRPSAWWTADEGARLRSVTALMLRHALDLALTLGDRDGSDAPQKTVRYLQGSTERMERAHVLRASCGRAVIRTLRGVLMSVPLVEPAEPNCADAVVLR